VVSPEVLAAKAALDHAKAQAVVSAAQWDAHIAQLHASWVQAKATALAAKAAPQG
jgi:hypothetical protein